MTRWRNKVSREGVLIPARLMLKAMTAVLLPGQGMFRCVDIKKVQVLPGSVILPKKIGAVLTLPSELYPRLECIFYKLPHMSS